MSWSENAFGHINLTAALTGIAALFQSSCRRDQFKSLELHTKGSLVPTCSGAVIAKSRGWDSSGKNTMSGSAAVTPFHT